jgi:hypothetical protein
MTRKQATGSPPREVPPGRGTRQYAVLRIYACRGTSAKWSTWCKTHKHSTAQARTLAHAWRLRRVQRTGRQGAPAVMYQAVWPRATWRRAAQRLARPSGRSPPEGESYRWRSAGKLARRWWNWAWSSIRHAEGGELVHSRGDRDGVSCGSIQIKATKPVHAPTRVLLHGARPALWTRAMWLNQKREQGTNFTIDGLQIPSKWELGLFPFIIATCSRHRPGSTETHTQHGRRRRGRAGNVSQLVWVVVNIQSSSAVGDNRISDRTKPSSTPSPPLLPPAQGARPHSPPSRACCRSANWPTSLGLLIRSFKSNIELNLDTAPNQTATAGGSSRLPESDQALAESRTLDLVSWSLMRV